MVNPTDIDNTIIERVRPAIEKPKQQNLEKAPPLRNILPPKTQETTIHDRPQHKNNIRVSLK